MRTLSLVSFFKKASIAAALALCALGAVSPAFAAKYASIVIDLDTSKVLHARDADESRYPASLTKVMTLYLVFDALDAGKLKLSDKMAVSRLASRQQPSKLGLKAGTSIKVEDAIRALVTKSANDVAVVLAEKLGGTQDKFVAKMNAKAAELGLEHTTFRNASGLPDRKQVTTARDMAKLAEAIYMDHRDRYNYFSTPDFVWNKRRYANHNELLKRVDGVDGIKTGFTNASGYNLMASASRNGHRVIAVMLGGSTGKSRDQHVADLLEAAFLEIGGGSDARLAELNQRIAMEGKDLSTDDLILAQLRKLEGAASGTQLASGEDADSGGTDEDEDDGTPVAQGDGDDSAAPDSAASPAPAPVEASAPPAAVGVTSTAVAAAPPPAPSSAPVGVTTTVAAAPAPAAPASEPVLVTSELPAKAPTASAGGAVNASAP
ncbi:MAG TPA: D-alanyl-D-alanine carboxypeptidase family protein [Hyphomonadaceae bacterium]|nr:D-alanyl-D-alanine carboxypeptidase family protein [Hyphomonadaceae bacterium]